MTSHKTAQYLIGSMIALAASLGFATDPAHADSGMVAVAGTWERGGRDTHAWYDLGSWKLILAIEGGGPVMGPSDPIPWIPVVGDWDGDGIDSVQMFNPWDWRLVPAERGPVEGMVGDPIPWQPVAGDWDGDGIDTVLVFDARDESLHRLEEGPIPVERYVPPAQPLRAAAGDWDADGFDTLVTYYDREPAPAPVWVTLFGDWDGDRIDTEADLHLLTGGLVHPEEESLTAPAMTTEAGSVTGLFDAGFGDGSDCYKVIKNKKVTYYKKWVHGVPVITCKVTYELWTCCQVSITGGWLCSVQNVTKYGPPC